MEAAQTEQKTALPVTQRRQYAMYTQDAADLVRLDASGELVRWAKNRPLVESTISAIANHLRSRPGEDWLLGPVPIFMARVGAVPVYHLMDGQHRLAALKRVRLEGPCRVHVCKITCAAEADLATEFQNINCGTPVPASYWNDKVRSVLGAYLDMLKRRFPKLESSAKNPQRPRYSRAGLMALLDQPGPLREAIIHHNITEADLMGATIALNDLMETRHRAGALAVASGKMLKSARRHGFYLGTENKTPWVHELISVVAPPDESEG